MTRFGRSVKAFLVAVLVMVVVLLVAVAAGGSFGVVWQAVATILLLAGGLGALTYMLFVWFE